MTKVLVVEDVELVEVMRETLGVMDPLEVMDNPTPLRLAAIALRDPTATSPELETRSEVTQKCFSERLLETKAWWRRARRGG